MSDRASKTRWLNSTVLGIGRASLFSDTGHEMATAAMPALLASLGANSAMLGIIEGLADGLSSFAKLASGTYSDRLHRRKPLAVLGYFLTAAGMASFAFATRAWHVLVGRLYVAYNVVYTASCYVAGVLADAHPKQRVLAAGYAAAEPRVAMGYVIATSSLLGASVIATTRR
ncbi:MAG TPA: hypothetical protein VMM27_05435 [Casimicrobiaceae bacterium]|nr:hypothetical protein [Casimicrobiaceae bacterium]